jgi:hypothetical protein
MNKPVFLILLGSALVAFGFSGWHADMRPAFTIAELSDQPGAHMSGWAGWTLANQIEITSGVVLLVWGILMRLKIKGDTSGETRKQNPRIEQSQR